MNIRSALSLLLTCALFACGDSPAGPGSSDLSVVLAGTGTGRVSATPSGITCGSDCTERYANGTLITLTATPDVGSTFTGWNGGRCAGSGPCTFRVTDAANVTATFTLNHYILTAARAGTGLGSVASTPAGITCGTDCTESYAHGTSVTLTPTPATGSTFSGWSGAAACTGTGPCVVPMTAAASVTATFTLSQYVLTTALAGTGLGSVASTPAGITCGTDCTESYAHGTSVTLTPTPVTGSTFAGWGGACSGTGGCVVAMTAAASVTASFTLNQYVLSTALAGTGSGSVASVPAGITCGTDCTESYAHGTSVTLTPTPATGSTFNGWSGACSGTGSCVVPMTAATTVTATFTLNQYVLSTALAGTGGGALASSPAGITCGVDCTESYAHGTSVTLTPTPATGSTFVGWGGACSGTGACVVPMTAAASVTATFTLNQYVLSTALAGTGSGAIASTPAGITCGVDCDESYSHGTSVTLTPTPATGSTFAGWSGACSGTGACVVPMTAAATVTATFTLNQYLLTTARAGTGTGGVASTPAGITCGADCTESYAHGTSVTLTATPATGSSFTSWSGACTGTGACVVPMTAAASATATFTLNQYTLTVVRTGTGTGRVWSDEGGIDCGSDCSELYDYGTAVFLNADADPGSVFVGYTFSPGCTGATPCEVTATFQLAMTLSVARDGSGTGTVTSTPVGITCGATCSAPFAEGATVRLTASPSVGSIFTGWSVPSCPGTGTCDVTMSAAASVTATFVTAPPE